MTEQEKAFDEWWERVEPYLHLYNVRMIFDAGYQAAKDNQ